MFEVMAIRSGHGSGSNRATRHRDRDGFTDVGQGLWIRMNQVDEIEGHIGRDRLAVIGFPADLVDDATIEDDVGTMHQFAESDPAVFSHGGPCQAA